MMLKYSLLDPLLKKGVGGKFNSLRREERKFIGSWCPDNMNRMVTAEPPALQKELGLIVEITFV